LARAIVPHLATTIPLAATAGVTAWSAWIFGGGYQSFVDWFDPYFFVNHGIFITPYEEAKVLDATVALAMAGVGFATRFVGKWVSSNQVKVLNERARTLAVHGLSCRAQERIYDLMPNIPPPQKDLAVHIARTIQRALFARKISFGVIFATLLSVSISMGALAAFVVGGSLTILSASFFGAEIIIAGLGIALKYYSQVTRLVRLAHFCENSQEKTILREESNKSLAPESKRLLNRAIFLLGPWSHLVTTIPLAATAGLAAWHVPIFFERGHSFSFVEGFDPYIFVQHGIFIGAFGESFVLATAVALAGASVGLAARFVGQQLAVRGINNSGYSPTKAFENLSLQAQARLYKYLSSVHETASCVVDDLPRQKQSEPGQDYEINDEAEKVRSQRAKQRRARRNQWFEEQLGPKYWGILAPLFHIPSLAGIFTRGGSALPKNP